MKAMTISLFILMFCLSMSILGNVPMFAMAGNTLAAQQYTGINQTIHNGMAGVQQNNLTLANDDVFGFRTLWAFKNVFFSIIGQFLSYAITIVPLMVSIGIPSFIAIPVQLIIYVIYIAAIIEFIINKQVIPNE